MTYPLSPEDRPDPNEQHAVRARVPDHVARGVFSTGVIVMTAPTEFVLDFIQNLGRPHQIVARVILPHPVMPQFVEALLKNIDLYRGRYGNLPQPNMAGISITSASGPVPGPGAAPQPRSAGPAAGSHASGTGQEGAGPGFATESQVVLPGQPAVGSSAGGGMPHEQVPPQNVRRASAQEIYDDLKLRDELLSGAYANAVMIGHGPHEFSFDFITNFYPHSAVSARVFLAAGQVARLADSLRGAWDQIRHRFQPPGEPPFPGPSSRPGPEGEPPEG
jgi:hypothetical protein